MDAIGQILTQFAAILQSAASLDASGADIQQAALRLARLSRNDVDDAVDGVRAPQGRAGAADHLDPVDILGWNRLHVPINPAEQGCVDAAAVDQDEQLVRQAGVVSDVEAARRDRIAGRTELGHFQVRRQPQHLGHSGRARADDVVMADHIDRRRRIAQRLRRFRNRRYLDIRQIFYGQVPQSLNRLAVGLGRQNSGE
jgi:hypothetical protein